MRLQDFRFFIPPNFPLKEKRPSRRLQKQTTIPRGNLFRYDEAKLRVLRILHQLLNFVSIADYYLSLMIKHQILFLCSFNFYFSGLSPMSAFQIKFLFSLLSGKMAASSFSTCFGHNLFKFKSHLLILQIVESFINFSREVIKLRSILPQMTG